MYNYASLFASKQKKVMLLLAQRFGFTFKSTSRKSYKLRSALKQNIPGDFALLI